MSHIRKIITFYLDLPDEARRRLLSDTILTAESARKVEKEVKAIIRAELQLNQKKKMLLFKADKEKKELEEKTQFLKNRTEFLEEENNSLEDANALLKDERDRLLPIEREFNKLRHQNEQLEISWIKKNNFIFILRKSCDSSP